MGEFEMPEKPDSRKERIVGLIIAAIAVVLAIVSALGHETHNDEILAHVDAADKYAFYQAKKERHEQLQLASDELIISRDRLSASIQARADQMQAGYDTEIKKLDSDSKKIQQEGDDLMHESDRLAHKASVLDIGEIALQISIVLCSISILTEQNLFVRMGIGMALIGALVALWGVFAM